MLAHPVSTSSPLKRSPADVVYNVSGCRNRAILL